MPSLSTKGCAATFLCSYINEHCPGEIVNGQVNHKAEYIYQARGIVKDARISIKRRQMRVRSRKKVHYNGKRFHKFIHHLRPTFIFRIQRVHENQLKKLMLYDIAHLMTSLRGSCKENRLR